MELSDLRSRMYRVGNYIKESTSKSLDSLKSDIADMKNTGTRMGGASIAGVFLKEFVEGVKWCHLDVAGTAFLEKPQKEFIAGSTGVGVRTLLNYYRF